MAEKKPFVLRINPETLKELESWAQEEFRSVNGQIEYLLHEALRKRKRGKSDAPDSGEVRPAGDQKKNAQP
ncbi:ribbon-helix-helix domain-containing protein [Tellurirhabdus rosea]|uniref:ribbon-helix-helix domain-containing protein n=1 Tax=Tellurirhabdus rosea TaxID=2674997 RepID=UPI002255BAC3|nr:Arc family DNA-binding protein [Tellurirhabdus rosea]